MKLCFKPKDKNSIYFIQQIFFSIIFFFDYARKPTLLHLITYKEHYSLNCSDTNTANIYIHIYPTPPLGQDMTQGQFLSGV